jgi:type II restriction/modification system DNA methylase subunit YeeA
LMPQTESETQPEVLKLLRSGSLPAELQPHSDEARLQGLLDGRIPTATAGADPQGEVYRELILAVCRSYHQLLPNLFEGLDDASELLLPDDLLSDGSIAGGFRSQIGDSDCEDVEIIGWLYQFYISEKKDQVIGKVVKSEDIPAATQLFTPNWIVKYMVQNSLGAQWLATYPASALKGQMEYYIEPAEQTDDVKAQLAAITPEVLNPEELTLIDPACGSGHILVEAYELFKAIYLERGYQQREIPQLILEKNLFGLDIDERAAQLTSFALMMKGRGDDRRLFERGIQLNVMALMNSDGLDVEALANAINLADHGLKLADLVELKQLLEHATTFGSLIQVPDGLAEKLPALRRLSELTGQDMIVAKALKILEPLVRQAEFLAAQYDAVAANPPYMGSKGMNALLKELASTNFPISKVDLFACFMTRGYSLAMNAGRVAMVTMQSWMFLMSYEDMRKQMLLEKTIQSMAHLGSRAFGTISGDVVQTTAFVIKNDSCFGYLPVFFRLLDGGEGLKQQMLSSGQGRFDRTNQGAFQLIPGIPIAYWASEAISSAFARLPRLESIASPKHGMTTFNNDKFLRLWHEVDRKTTWLSASSQADALMSGAKWFPFNKGGSYRKWYGNHSYLINWKNNGEDVKYYIRDKNPNVACGESFFFKEGFTWGEVASSQPSFRHLPKGFILGNKGPTVIASSLRLELLGFLNCVVCSEMLKLLNPTTTLSVGNVCSLPIADTVRTRASEEIASSARDLAMRDWDSFEFSWSFAFHPIIIALSVPAQNLAAGYNNWVDRSNKAISEMKHLEEENNRIFIEAYGLQDELTPEVPIEQITLTVNPAYRYGGNLSEDELWNRFRQDTIKEFLSYATGCMMGRYSLDHPGLILANAGDTLENYVAKVGKSNGDLSFQPDRDGIIPVLDGEWFENDIVARSREFLRVCFPASSLNTDLAFIETALGKDLRKYFCSDFYKDHLQTYKKRPIYWLVQSPAGPAKGGFACLIYLHRYTKDTLNLVLNNYFRPYLQKLEARQAQLGLDQLNDAIPSRDRTAARKEAEKITKVLKECQAWEQDSLLPLAQQRIELDLDDGVKVNYLKLQDVLAPIPGLAAKEE